MTRQKSILVIMIVSLAFNIAFISGFAYRLHERSKHPKPPLARGFKKERYTKERLEIPDELRRKMHEVHRQFSPRMRELREKIRDERGALMEILMAEEPDSTAIECRLKRIGTIQLDIEREVVHRLFREKDLLPLEQRRQFLEMVMRRWDGRPHPPRKGDGTRRPIQDEKKDKDE